nr:BlaI/MecI/CopY family transcriptional regulator [Eubacterium sp.]
MRDNLLSESEMAFARIVWENEPLPSGELVKLCMEKLGWKKPTTYTVLRNLCQAGIFKNENTIVSAVMTLDDYLARESKQIVNERFDGSIARFVTSFADKSKLSKNQIEELKKFIEECE